MENESADRMNSRGNEITVLCLSESDTHALAMKESLAKFEGTNFQVLWHQTPDDVFNRLAADSAVDVIVTEDTLPGMSGVEFVRILKEKKIGVPLVFLSTSNDIHLAVEVMRMGVKDFLLKEEIANHIFPQTLLRIVEKERLKREFSELEVKQKRLEAMQEIVVEISTGISKPLEEMSGIVQTLEEQPIPEKPAKYLKLIKENVERMQVKLEKLRNLKEDKTVKYIRDIKMIDLS